MTYLSFTLPEPLIALLIGCGAVVWSLLGETTPPPPRTFARKVVAGMAGSVVGWYIVPIDWPTWAKYLACSVLAAFGDKVRPMAVRWANSKVK